MNQTEPDNGEPAGWEAEFEALLHEARDGINGRLRRDSAANELRAFVRARLAERPEPVGYGIMARLGAIDRTTVLKDEWTLTPGGAAELAADMPADIQPFVVALVPVTGGGE